jgi:hypothetical protein
MVNKQSWRADEWKLKKDILPAWRHVPVKDIKRADVAALDGIADPRGRNAPQSALHVRRTLSMMFNFAPRVTTARRAAIHRRARAESHGQNRHEHLRPVQLCEGEDGGCDEARRARRATRKAFSSEPCCLTAIVV